MLQNSFYRYILTVVITLKTRLTMAKKSSGGSKNNISNRGKGALLRSFGGVEVEPLMYFHNGKKVIVAKGKESGKIVTDQSGNPVLYKEADKQLFGV